VAEPITADRAQALGLVHRVVPAGQVLAEARSLAQSILKGAPDAVRHTKRHLQDLRATSISAQFAQALESHKAARSSEEAKEGLAAFLEHREPAWTKQTSK
jgi:methylglutaconyl-CoA hydratase